MSRSEKIAIRKLTNYEYNLAKINKTMFFPRILAICEVTKHSGVLHPLTFLKKSNECGIVSLHYATLFHVLVPANGRKKCLQKTGAPAVGLHATHQSEQGKSIPSTRYLVYLIILSTARVYTASLERERHDC